MESIDKLRSVDLVADAGTTSGLFEAAAPEEPQDPDAAMAEAFSKAVVAVCQSSADLKAKLKKIKEILTAQEKLGGKDEGEGQEAPAEDAPAQEWRQEYETLKTEKACRDLCENNNVAAERPLVESLMSMTSDKARADFVAWHRRKAVVKQPRSAEPVVPAQKETNLVDIVRGYR